MFSVMEKDFMGIAGKDLSMKEEVRGGSCNDSVFLESSSVHNKFQNKMSNLQQFMSFKQEQEGSRKKNVCGQFSSSAFQPTGCFDTSSRHFSVIPQKKLGFDDQGNHLFPMPVFSSPSTGSFGKVMHQLGLSTAGDAKMVPMPRNQVNNFLAGRGSGCVTNLSAVSPKQQQLQPFGGMSRVHAPVSRNTNSTFATRTSTMCVPATAQLTIFYGGVINVYDDVPIEKAQEIMFLASNSSRVSSDAVNPREQKPLMPSRKVMEAKATNMNNIQPIREVVEDEPVKTRRIQTQANVASPGWGFSSPVSVTSHSAAHSGNSSSSGDDTKRQKSNTTTPPSVPKRHNETLKPVSSVEDGSSAGSTPMLRAIPMARKASLARFLEKRKERVCSAAPYSTQKPVECSSVRVVGMQTFPVGTKTLEVSSLQENGKQYLCLRGSTKHTTNDKPPIRRWRFSCSPETSACNSSL